MFTRTTTLTAWTLLLAAQPAAAEFRLERRLALQPGGQFILNSDIGSVTITGDAASEAIVTVTASDDDLDDRYDFRFEESAQRVTVTIERDGGWVGGLLRLDWFRDRDVRIAIRVPQKTEVDARTSGGSVKAFRLTGDARLRTSGGSLNVDNLGGDLEARTSGGSIRVSMVQGNVEARTSGGSIEMADVRGEVRAKTSGGSVRVRQAGGRVEAHTSGGGVAVGFAPGNNRGGMLSASGGSIRAELDPTIALSIDAKSSGGSVIADVPVSPRLTPSDEERSTRRRNNFLRGDLKGSGALLHMRTSGGGIRIVRASDS